MYQNDSVLLSLSRFGCSFRMSNCPNHSFRSCHALVTLLYVWQQVGVWHSNRAKTSCTELFEVHFVQQDLSFTCFEFINFCFVLWYLFNVIDFFLNLSAQMMFLCQLCVCFAFRILETPLINGSPTDCDQWPLRKWQEYPSDQAVPRVPQLFRLQRLT